MSLCSQIAFAGKAVVFDHYLSGLGGGERSALAYAKALLELGMDAEVVATQPLPPASRIFDSFGGEFESVPMRYLEPAAMTEEFKSKPPFLFVNHTFKNFLPNPGRFGIYSQMFPVIRVGRGNRPQDVAALKTYDLLLSNSSFTKKYTDHLWDYPVDRSKVLHPPIGQTMSERALATSVSPPAKDRLFLSIGRFAVYPANKNQKLLIESFLEARNRDPLLESWKLALVGNQNPDEGSERYFRECQALAAASGGAVEIHHELPQPQLIDYLERAFGYVHGAGAFHPPGSEAHQCEHLGLSIVEGMAYGCLPLLYARGGVFDILDVARAGFPYATREGLVDGFSALAALYGSPEHQKQQAALGEMARALSFERFTESLGQIIEQAQSGTNP